VFGQSGLLNHLLIPLAPVFYHGAKVTAPPPCIEVGILFVYLF
jgi:hypothetical protein